MNRVKTATKIFLAVMILSLQSVNNAAQEKWTQYKYDSRHSGNVPAARVQTPLGLQGAVALTDAIFTAPVIDGNRAYVVDGAGVAFCIDTDNLSIVWKYSTAGGKANCNNISSPALAGGYLHFGTMAGIYYILDAKDGTVVRTIDCGDPVFCSPVIAGNRVYFASLGSRIYALAYDGTILWRWDFVKERLAFTGDRWSGMAWREAKGWSTWKHQFCCSRNIAVFEDTLVVPCGGPLIWLRDAGDHAEFRGQFLGRRETPATLGLSIGEDGKVYRQWTRRDNGGSVQVLQWRNGKINVDFVRGTETSWDGPGSIGYESVSTRGSDVYRCRAEEGFAFCRHSPGKPTCSLGGYPSNTPPILLKNNAVYGGLDGRLYVVPLDGSGKCWSFKTAFGRPVTAPAAVCGGRIYFGCEDGYFYVLGPGGKAPLPERDQQLWRIRSPLTSKLSAPRYDWFTSFGNLANTNCNRQQVGPPFKMKWIRRYDGTVKHFSVCGGGRIYTHTAEGQIFALEEETGRLLWRRYFPGVHVSFTSPIYDKELLFIPQAGIKRSRLRCLKAATGELIWEAPFTGSPSWNRQLPPILYKDLVIYQFSTGKYTAKTWLFEHQNTFGFSPDQRPLIRAWNRRTGKVVWTRDFSRYGAGGDDAGMCLMDGTLYYTCYFGAKNPSGITAALDPASGKTIWLTTKYGSHAGCTISGKDGRLYLGGYNPLADKKVYVWCLDARNGNLVWRSDPVEGAIHVITIGDRFLFTHAQYRDSYIIDKETGKILHILDEKYRCTRFTLSEPYLLGSNLNIHDLSVIKQDKLVSCGPALDVLQCVGPIVSNGRIFYTDNGGGLQASMMWGQDARTQQPVWQTR